MNEPGEMGTNPNVCVVVGRGSGGVDVIWPVHEGPHLWQ